MNLNRMKVRYENFVRIIESHKAGETVVRGYPVRLMIEPTNICDLKCPLCPVGAGTLTRKRGMMSFDNFCKIVDGLTPYLNTILLWNYGEPFINPDIYDMIRYARTRQIKIISSTNGYPLHHDFPNNIERLLDCGLDHLIVSIDGATPQTHAAYRIGSDLSKIIAGIKHLLKLRSVYRLKRPLIDIQFIAMKSNEQELIDLIKWSKNIGADQFSIKTVNVNMPFGPQTHDEAQEIIPSFEMRSQRLLSTVQVISKRDNRIQRKSAPHRSCAHLWEEIVVNQDGEVAPCCYDINASLSLGNAFHKDIKEIWNSPKYIELRRLVNISREQIPLCSICNDGVPIFLARFPLSDANSVGSQPSAISCQHSAKGEKQIKDELVKEV